VVVGGCYHKNERPQKFLGADRLLVDRYFLINQVSNRDISKTSNNRRILAEQIDGAVFDGPTFGEACKFIITGRFGWTEIELI